MKSRDNVCILVFGYIKENSLIWIPNSIADMISLFHGFYNISFDSNIMDDNQKVRLMEIMYKEFNDSVILSRIYCGSIHGFTNSGFNKQCVNKSPTIVLIKNSNEYIFGGYTSISWKNLNRNVNDKNAFLFTIHPNTEIFKQTHNNNGNYAVFQYSDTSVWILGFGGSFFIPNNCDKVTSMTKIINDHPIYDFKKGCQLVGTKVGKKPGKPGIITYLVQEMEIFKVNTDNIY